MVVHFAIMYAIGAHREGTLATNMLKINVCFFVCVFRVNVLFLFFYIVKQ